MLRQYTVTGRWPFPVDMLRRDDARPASEADQLLIDRLSKDHTEDGFGLIEPVSVNLVMDAGTPSRGFPNGRRLPLVTRWESFGGWKVSGLPELDELETIRQASKPVKTVRTDTIVVDEWADGALRLTNKETGDRFGLTASQVALLKMLFGEQS
jgi:hypothetical protein